MALKKVLGFSAKNATVETRTTSGKVIEQTQLFADKNTAAAVAGASVLDKNIAEAIEKATRHNRNRNYQWTIGEIPNDGKERFACVVYVKTPGTGIIKIESRWAYWSRKDNVLQWRRQYGKKEYSYNISMDRIKAMVIRETVPAAV